MHYGDNTKHSICFLLLYLQTKDLSETATLLNPPFSQKNQIRYAVLRQTRKANVKKTGETVTAKRRRLLQF